MRDTSVICLVLLALTGLPRVAGADPMKDAVQAKRIRDRLVIEARTDANQKVVLQYRIDHEPAGPRNFTTGLVFVASDEILITFPRFNPLEFQAVASVTETDDPAHAALTQLLRSLTSMAGILRPDLAEKFKLTAGGTTPVVATVEQCTPRRDAQAELRKLIDALYPSDLAATALRAAIASWKKDISDTGQPGVVRTTERLGALQQIATSAIALGKAQAEAFQQAESAARLKTDWPSADCRADTLEVYDLARLADVPERLRELETVGASIKKLADSLSPFAASKDWLEDDARQLRTWVINRIAVDEAKAKQVTVKVGAVGFSVSDDAGITSAATSEATGVFGLRQHRPLIPEIGVGAIVADLHRPKYVVGKNDAGATVVARGASEDVPLSAAVMGNLVFRTNLGWGAPMLQLGGLPSKDAPGVLVGGGLRFFARFGISAGVVRWWAKDLRVDPSDPTLLKVGSPVATQKDIEDKLTWVGRNTFFMSFQYSF